MPPSSDAPGSAPSFFSQREILQIASGELLQASGSAKVETGAMLKYLMPANLKRVVVYLQPISMRWGATKLRSLCRDELAIEPDPSTAFLFVNKSHDCLLLYSTDSDGDRTLTKKIEKGAFIVPAPGPDGPPFVIMRPSVLARMFRS